MRLRNKSARKHARRLPLWGVACALVFAGLAPGAHAEVLTVGPTPVENAPASDSSADVVAFQDLVAGETLTRIPFTRQSDGTPIDLSVKPCGTCPGGEGSAGGSDFSTRVTFRSTQATYPEVVLIMGDDRTPPDDDYRIGPAPAYFGELELDFEGAAGAVSAVGLGVVGLAQSDTIRLYDAEDIEILPRYVHPGSRRGWVFIGFVSTTEEDRIGRLVIDSGSQYAVGDIALVPEPAAGLATLAVLLGVAGLRARKQRHSAPPTRFRR